MTPMIDMVFLLLTFFVLTFKIIAPEGDFNIGMIPQGDAVTVETNTDSVLVRLIARPDGRLESIQLNDENVDIGTLRRRVEIICQKNPDVEVVLFPDEHLHYEYVIQAITAVNGEWQEGRIHKICNNIKFTRDRGDH